jgi:hypothetical protein
MPIINPPNIHVTEDGRLFASNQDYWYMKRMTAGPIDVHESVESVDLTDEKLRLHVDTILRPYQWRILPPDVKRDARHFNFNRINEQSNVVKTEEQLLGWLDAGWTTYNELQEETTLNRLIVNTELPHWRKLTNQKGVQISSHVARQGPGYTGMRIPADFVKVCRFVLAQYAFYTGASDYRPDPAETNCGWPTMATGNPAGKVVGRLLVHPDDRTVDIMEMCKQFSQIAGLPEKAYLGYGLARRSGPVYKDLPLLRYKTGNVWSEIGTWKGCYQRNRTVQMSSAGANNKLHSLYAVLNGARRRINGLWHEGGGNASLLKGYEFHVESDLSSFDITVPPELQDLLRDEMSYAFPHLEDKIIFWRVMENRPLISPSWSLDKDTVSILSYDGGTRSGLKMTSEIGTLISVCAVLYSLYKQGFDYTKWPSINDEFAFLILGDDVRLSTSRRIDPEGWEAAHAVIGLKAEIVEGHGFLSRHTSSVLKDSPIGGRIVQQTMSNEHEVVGKKYLGLQYLGFLARTNGFDALPSLLQERIWKCITNADWIQELKRETKLNSISELRYHLENSRTIREKIASALLESEGQEWYRVGERAADHSRSSFERVRIAKQIVADVGTEAESLDALIDSVSIKLGTQSRGDRMRLALEGFIAVSSSTNEGWKWLHQVIKSYNVATHSYTKEA